MRSLSMFRFLLATSTLSLGATASADVGDPIDGLTAEELAVFEAGKALFERDITVAEGVGPFMNAVNCKECHDVPVLGGSADDLDDFVQNFGVDYGGRFYESHHLGGPIIHRHSLESLGVPDRAGCDAPPKVLPVGVPLSILSLRDPPPLFGAGLVDALSDKRILKNQGASGNKAEGVLGAPNWSIEMEGQRGFPGPTLIFPRTVPSGAPRVGRFGWKAQNGSLFLFASEALQNELGVTTAFHDRENHPAGLGTDDLPEECKLADTQANDQQMEKTILIHNFMAMLAPPERGDIGKDEKKGAKLFKQVGCQDCHTKKQRTVDDYYTPFPGGEVHRVDALSDQKFFPFSDFLLHDLGEANSDNRNQGRATGKLWRTTPLWGLRHKTSMLHDGSATTFDEAISAHGGEAASSRDAYFALPEEKQEQVDAFLGSL